MDITSTSTRIEAWKALSGRGMRVLTTNGWSDQKVPPILFGPLHDLLMYNLSSPNYTTGFTEPGISSHGLREVTSKIFANITHEMYDVNDPYQVDVTYP